MAGEPQECAGSVHALRLRIARLEANGVPDPGPDNLYVTDALVRISNSPVVVEGDDFEQKNGGGIVCVSYKSPDTIKRVDLTMQICTPDPRIHEMLCGGEVLIEGGEVVGWAYPEVGVDPNPNGVSIEAWSRAIIGGTQASTRPYWRHVFPRTKWRPSDRTLANEVMVPEFAGFSEQNDNWFDGPANDWPHTSDRVYQYARDDVLPASQCGAQTLAAS